MKKRILIILVITLFVAATFIIFLSFGQLRQLVNIKKELHDRNIYPTQTAQEIKDKVENLPIVSNLANGDGKKKEENVPIELDSGKFDFTFAVLGDTQRFSFGDSQGGLQQAIRSISSQEQKIDFVMTVGDLLSSCDGKSGCESKLGEWKSTLGSLYAKTYEVMGNHDRTGGEKSDELWQKFFTLPTNGPSGFSELAYSFDVKNSHFVVLNSEKPEEHLINKTQRDWLEKDLAANAGKNLFVFYHEPAYPVSSKIGESQDVKSKDRDALWSILEKYKVKAVFNGHEHISSRKKIGSVYQFGIGNTDSFNHDAPKAGMAEFSYVGKHFAIVGVKDQKVTVNVYTVNGKLLNSFSF